MTETITIFGMREIRFKFSPQKALNAIQWMVSEGSGIDLHTVMKACYFADKTHLNEHGRPVFGATYRAMRFGPVPVEVYEIAKGESLWLAELQINQLPWRNIGYHLSPMANEKPDLDVFSDSDLDAIRTGFARSRAMDFSARTAATHGLDWQRAELGEIRYEDMIDEGPEKANMIERLRETARFLRL